MLRWSGTGLEELEMKTLVLAEEDRLKLLATITDASVEKSLRRCAQGSGS